MNRKLPHLWGEERNAGGDLFFSRGSRRRSCGSIVSVVYLFLIGLHTHSTYWGISEILKKVSREGLGLFSVWDIYVLKSQLSYRAKRSAFWRKKKTILYKLSHPHIPLTALKPVLNTSRLLKHHQSGNIFCLLCNKNTFKLFFCKHSLLLLLLNRNGRPDPPFSTESLGIWALSFSRKHFLEVIFGSTLSVW